MEHFKEKYLLSSVLCFPRYARKTQHRESKSTTLPKANIKALMPNHPLDEGQYSLKEIAKYEAIYGRNFISPGGAATTREILGLAGWRAGMSVLDIGCGLGGAAFLIAQTYGARVQ